MKDATDITMIIDRSGSMASIRDDTVGGIKTFVDGQKAAQGECHLTVVQFDSENPQEVVIDHQPVASVGAITLTPRGNTPLYDAVGLAIVRTGQRLAAMPEQERPEKVICVIVTDGQENASSEYTRERIAEMVKAQTETYKWQFVYIGANQDAIMTAQAMNIPAAMAMSYTADSKHVNAMYASLTSNVVSARAARGVAVAASLAWTDEQRKKSVNPTPTK